ncbi:MAG TPA: hypothetical protein VMC62_05810 [Longilinea sp.]|nr:hypothetical protein [Longilinea sp.]
MKSLSIYIKFGVFSTLLVMLLAACVSNSPTVSSMQSTAVIQPSQAAPTSETQSPVPTESGTQMTAPTVSGTPQFGTPDEAKAMLQKAIDHYNKVGRDQALQDFTNRVAPFFDRDLYVACIDSTLTQTANGGYPQYVGTQIQPLSQSDWDNATSTSVSSITYAWLNPETNELGQKTFFFEKVGSDVCGVGAYAQ